MKAQTQKTNLKVFEYQGRPLDYGFYKGTLVFSVKSLRDLLGIKIHYMPTIRKNEVLILKLSNDLFKDAIKEQALNNSVGITVYPRPLHTTGELFLTEQGMLRFLKTSYKKPTKEFLEWLIKYLPNIKESIHISEVEENLQAGVMSEQQQDDTKKSLPAAILKSVEALKLELNVAQTKWKQQELNTLIEIRDSYIADNNKVGVSLYNNLITEIITGKSVSPILPVEVKENLYTLDEIAEKMELSTELVEGVVKDFQLETSKYGKFFWERDPNTYKLIKKFMFNDSIFEAIRDTFFQDYKKEEPLEKDEPLQENKPLDESELLERSEPLERSESILKEPSEEAEKLLKEARKCLKEIIDDSEECDIFNFSDDDWTFIMGDK